MAAAQPASKLGAFLQETESAMQSFDWERFADWFTPHRVTAAHSRRAEFQQLLQQFAALRRRLTVLNAADRKAACALWLRCTPERIGVPVFLLPQAQAEEQVFIEAALGHSRVVDLSKYRQLRTSMALSFDEGDRTTALAQPASATGQAITPADMADLLCMLEAREEMKSPHAHQAQAVLH